MSIDCPLINEFIGYMLYFTHRVGYNVKKLFQEKDVYKDRESQIEAIEETFKAAKMPVRIATIFFKAVKYLVSCASGFETPQQTWCYSKGSSTIISRL